LLTPIEAAKIKRKLGASNLETFFDFFSLDIWEQIAVSCLFC
jgi:hypothetical protein